MFKGPKGIRVVPAASGVAELANIDELDWDDFSRQLNEIRTDYDFFLIDTGSGIGPMVGELLFFAGEAIVVTRPESLALANAYALIKLMVRDNPSYPFHLLINMVRNSREAQNVCNSMEQILLRFLSYRPGIAGFVKSDPSVGHSVVWQVPFVLSHPKSPAAQCLRGIAQVLAGVEADPKEKDSKGLGLWEFLDKFRPKSHK
jgi:flagellar biosynthesis protein FlhG